MTCTHEVNNIVCNTIRTIFIFQEIIVSNHKYLKFQVKQYKQEAKGTF